MAHNYGSETSEPITVVCCGDCITYGAMNNNYVELLANRLITGESFASFSYRKGYQLLTDGVHMGPQGAALIAREIREYLDRVRNRVNMAEITH